MWMNTSIARHKLLTGAGEEIRTLDIFHGKEALYH